MTTKGTLCFIEKNGKYLMQKKASIKFGGGMWNAPGGKALDGETLEECATREVSEETGLRVKNLKHRGVLKFFNAGDFAWAVHVFITSDFEGELKESEEGKLEWMDKSALPYADMWEDDKHWVPLMMEGKHFEGDFHFKENFQGLVSWNVREARQ